MVGFVTCSFGQGEVLFVNTANAATQIYTTNVVNGWSDNVGGAKLLAPSGTFTFALYSAPLNVTNVLGGTPWLDPAWNFTGNYATNQVAAGRIGIATPNVHGAAAIPGYAAGSTAHLVVIGWNNSVGGTTESEFRAAWAAGTPGLLYGVSIVGGPPLGDGLLLTDSVLFGLNTGLIRGFTLAPVPEPTTFALAGLGAAAMLIFRRRK